MSISFTGPEGTSPIVVIKKSFALNEYYAATLSTTLNLSSLYSITIYNSNGANMWGVQSINVTLASRTIFQFGYTVNIGGTPVVLQAPLKMNAVTASKGATSSAVYATFTNTLNTNLAGSYALFSSASNGQSISATVLGVNSVADTTNWTVQLATFSSTGWNATALSFTKNGVVVKFNPIYLPGKGVLVTAVRS